MSLNHNSQFIIIRCESDGGKDFCLHFSSVSNRHRIHVEYCYLVLLLYCVDRCVMEFVPVWIFTHIWDASRRCWPYDRFTPIWTIFVRFIIYIKIIFATFHFGHRFFFVFIIVHYACAHKSLSWSRINCVIVLQTSE